MKRTWDEHELVEHWTLFEPDGALLANRKNFAQAALPLKQAHQNGCRDPICLRWLSISLLALGESGLRLFTARDSLSWLVNGPLRGGVRSVTTVRAGARANAAAGRRC